ncbi:MAG: histidine triad nucleotide-binding protein [Pseudomonadota bacterium]|nr:MAG: histidine triad nucleotide-binding protein [Pseudomonadota bacterium]
MPFSSNWGVLNVPDDLFVKIINREIPADIVYEDDEILAFRDIDPKAPVHLLVIPKRPIATLNDLEPADAELVGRLVLTARRLAAEAKIDEAGYRLVLNCNPGGGQSVYHIHLHLLGGRQMEWPPG